MRRMFNAGLAVVGCAVLVSIVPAVASGASFTWAGEAATGETGWSKTTNWEGGVAPSGTVGTLTFPKLASPKCKTKPREAPCYASVDDISGIKANAISIDDASPYVIGAASAADEVTLGAGGITAKPTVACGGEELCPGAELLVPLALAAPQTWSISGANGSGLSVSEVTGEEALTLNFANNTFLSLRGPVEVGEVKASGAGTIRVLGESLNAIEAAPIKLTNHASLFAPAGTIGPLEASEDSVQVSEGLYEAEPPERSVLQVEGNTKLSTGAALTLYLIHAGSAFGIDYSQLYVVGKLHLEEATLHVPVGFESVGEKSPCSHLVPGAVDKIIETTGTIEGEFVNAPQGAEIKPEFCAGEGDGELPPLRINYTEHAVTATVLESKEEKRHHEEEAAAHKHAEEEAAARKHAEEEAVVRKHTEEEAAARKHAEEEAGRKHAEEEAAHKRLEEQLHPTLKIGKVKVMPKGLQITLQLSQPGTVTLNAPGCKKVSKTLAAGVQRVTLGFNAKGKRERAQRRRIKLSVQLNDGHATVGAGKSVKL